MRLCEIFLHGIKCGTLQEDDNKEYSFTYGRAYLLGENAEPVSLTLRAISLKISLSGFCEYAFRRREQANSVTASQNRPGG